MLKRIGAGTVLLIFSILCTVAGLIIYGINATGDYYGDFNTNVIMAGAAGMLVVLLLLIAGRSQKMWTDFFYPLAGIIFTVAAVLFLSTRVESAAIILGSDLEAGNPLARLSLFQAFAGIGCFMAAMLLTGISGFFDQVKEAKSD